VTHEHDPEADTTCRYSAAQQMRVRLAKARLEELHGVDLAEAHPAALIVIIERLTKTVEDLLELTCKCQEG
jgi:hypothetical protein